MRAAEYRLSQVSLVVSFVINETSSSGSSTRCRFLVRKAFRRLLITFRAEICACNDAASSSADAASIGGGPIMLAPGSPAPRRRRPTSQQVGLPEWGRAGARTARGFDAYHSGGAVRVRRAAEQTPARAPGPILAQRRAAKDPATFQGTAPRSRIEGSVGVPRAGAESSNSHSGGLDLLALKTCSAASAAVSHRRFLGLEPGGCPARRGRTASIHTSDSSDARAIRAERSARSTPTALTLARETRPQRRGPAARDAVGAPSDSKPWARAAATSKG